MFRLTLAALALLCGSVARAQEPDPQVLDFRSALQRLVSVNETLQASRAVVAQSRAERAEAEAEPCGGRCARARAAARRVRHFAR